MRERRRREEWEAKQEDAVIVALNYAVVVLPALATLATTVSSRMKFMVKWGMMKSGEKQIEAEIYKFRTHVGESAVAFQLFSLGDRSIRSVEAFAELFYGKFRFRISDFHFTSICQISAASILHPGPAGVSSRPRAAARTRSEDGSTRRGDGTFRLRTAAAR